MFFTIPFQSEPVSRHWTKAPALAPDPVATAAILRKYPEERITPPARLSPLSDVPDLQRFADEEPNMTAANNGRRLKKKGRTPPGTDAGVQDALSKIRNARKRQPGSSFLAKGSSVPVENPAHIDNPALADYTGSSSRNGSAKLHGRLQSTSGYNLGAKPEARDLYNQFCKGGSTTQQQRRKTSLKKDDHSKSHVDLKRDSNSANKIKRTFKRPVADFRVEGTSSLNTQAQPTELQLQSVSIPCFSQ